MFLRALTIGCIILSMASCSSIIHGTTQMVNFSSQPKGATISIDGKEYGQTPQGLVLRRKGREKGVKSDKISYDVKIEMFGYKAYETKIVRKLDGWFFGNLLFGGIIGIIIDASNGSMYKLKPDQIMANLPNTSTGMIESKDDVLYVAVTLYPDPTLEKIGELEKD